VVEHDEEAEAETQAQYPGFQTILEDEELQTSAPLGTPFSLRRPSHVPSSPSQSMRLGNPTSPVRSRAGSTGSRSSGRPPLTTDVSFLTPLSPGSLHVSIRSRSGTGITISPPLVSSSGGATTSPADSERSYSYALGGTGGRAKRTRSTRSGSTGGIPTLGLPETSGAARREDERRRSQQLQAKGEGAKTPAWDVFGGRESAPAVGSGLRARAATATGAGSLGLNLLRENTSAGDLDEAGATKEA